MAREKKIKLKREKKNKQNIHIHFNDSTPRVKEIKLLALTKKDEKKYNEKKVTIENERK